jgi:hypothetical protein
MSYSEMWHRVILQIVTDNVGPSSLILSILEMEATLSSETAVIIGPHDATSTAP